MLRVISTALLACALGACVSDEPYPAHAGYYSTNRVVVAEGPYYGRPYQNYERPHHDWRNERQQPERDWRQERRERPHESRDRRNERREERRDFRQEQRDVRREQQRHGQRQHQEQQDDRRQDRQEHRNKGGGGFTIRPLN